MRFLEILGIKVMSYQSFSDMENELKEKREIITEYDRDMKELFKDFLEKDSLCCDLRSEIQRLEDRIKELESARNETV